MGAVTVGASLNCTTSNTVTTGCQPYTKLQVVRDLSFPHTQAIFPQTGLAHSQGVASSIASPEIASRRRSHAKDGEDDPSEKRQKFLERNRYECANGCRLLYLCLSVASGA